MIIAAMDIPEDLAIPVNIEQHAGQHMIEMTSIDVPFGADCWIACNCALPHSDPYYARRIFLTLSIRSNHEFGDLRQPDEESIPPGTLFVVDPRTHHWLVDAEFGDLGYHRPWIGVQWELNRKTACRSTRRIIQDLGARWIDSSDDKRYRYWARTEAPSQELSTGEES